MFFFKKNSSLFSRILIVLTIITVVFWCILYFVTHEFLKKTIVSEFTSSTVRMVTGIAKQNTNEIKYADYFQIQRNLRGFYDEAYMRYLAVYSVDGKILAMFPRQIDGDDYMFMEKTVLANAEKPSVQLFTKYKGDGAFHFQQNINDENGLLIGYATVGGTMRPLEKVLNTQTIFFTVFGFAVLLLQISAIGYASHVLMRPLKFLTKMLKKNEEVEPEKFLPELMTQKTPNGASSEVNLFYKIYQKLLQNIHAHQMHTQEMAVQASIGRIASHVAHDMRTPVSVLEGFVRLTPHSDDSEMKEYKISAANSVNKLQRMAEDLVDYTRAKDVQPAFVQLTQLLHEVTHELTGKVKEKKATLEFKCEKTLSAHLDPHKMNRVLANMIHNSIQSLPDKNGVIKILAHVTEKGWLAIAVEDNGSGIDPKHVPRLFDSSFTFGKPSGTGLGLSYCKNVVEAHGGRILVESKLGKGSKFTIEIPMAANKLTTIEPAHVFQNVPAKKAAESACSILVIDDDPSMLVQWKQILRELTDFEIVTAKSPEEMKIIDPKPEKFRAAICDYRFEGKETTGLDLIKILKDKGICCRYLCTGFYYDPELREQAIEAGAHAIIPKPIPMGLVQQLFG